jgi:ATP-dependent Clp protease adapter protein ClpS
MIFDLAEALWQGGGLRSGFDTDSDVLVDDNIVTTIALPYKVLLFNDNIHTFDEVIVQVCKAVECSQEHAEQVAWEVHTRGKSIVYDGEMTQCLRVSSVLEEIALHTQVVA